MTGPRDRGEQPGEAWLTRGVLGVGAASLCSDAGHEMVTSPLRTFLAYTLHSGPAALGAIEGVSDALTGVAKLAGGPLANDPSRRGRLASSGYLGGVAGGDPARARLDLARDPLARTRHDADVVGPT